MKQRDVSVDILRGLAIFSMIAANMAAHSLLEPHSFYFRLYGSLAAPLFVFLAGMMVSYTATLKQHKLNYYLKRSLATLAVAALMDIFLWDIFPFSTFDVLYVIAFAMPLIFFFNKLNLWLKVGLIALLFAAAPLLQNYFLYQEYPVELVVSEMTSLGDIANVPVLKQLFIDGWFPIFPWLGVSLIGGLIGSYKLKMNAEDFGKNVMGVGLILLLIGIFTWAVYRPELFIREGYSELFYPPTVYYMMTYLGLILILLPLAFKTQQNKLLTWLSVYGRSSLLVYILHTVFIIIVFYQIEPVSFVPFVGLYLCHAAVLWLICFGVQHFKKNRKFPFFLNFILGS